MSASPMYVSHGGPCGLHGLPPSPTLPASPQTTGAPTHGRPRTYSAPAGLSTPTTPSPLVQPVASSSLHIPVPLTHQSQWVGQSGPAAGGLSSLLQGLAPLTAPALTGGPPSPYGLTQMRSSSPIAGPTPFQLPIGQVSPVPWSPPPFFFDTSVVRPPTAADPLEATTPTSAPIGWHRPSTSAWQRLKDYETNQGESLLAAPLPLFLCGAANAARADSMYAFPSTPSASSRPGGDEFACRVPSGGSGLSPTQRSQRSPAPSRSNSALQLPGVVPSRMSSRQEMQPLLRPPPSDNQQHHHQHQPHQQHQQHQQRSLRTPQLQQLQPPQREAEPALTLEHLTSGFKTAWELVAVTMEAISGGWCSNQVNLGAPGVEGPQVSQLEFQVPSVVSAPVQATEAAVNAWLVRTAPPAHPAAQKGGAPSGTLGFRADGWEPPLDSGMRGGGGYGGYGGRGIGLDSPGFGGSIMPPGAASGGASSSGVVQASHNPAPHSPSRHPIERVISEQDAWQGLVRARCSLSSLKGNKATSPNQDRALYAALGHNGLELLSVMDGHGEVGHVVAELCIEVLPKLVLQGLTKVSQSGTGNPQNPQEAGGVLTPEWWREAVGQAYEDTHALLEAVTAETIRDEKESLSPVSAESAANGLSAVSRCLRVDARASGTTATLIILLPGSRFLVSHVGDSRAVLGVRRRVVGEVPPQWRVLEFTRDHKPDLPDERARIEESGAQVVSVGSPPNTTNRVFTPYQTWPSINMSRSLGDLHAHSQGLSALAEVRLVEQAFDPVVEEAVLVVASDGIWDVLDGFAAVDIAARAAWQNNEAAAALTREAYERWGQRGLQGGYSDDITAIVKFL